MVPFGAAVVAGDLGSGLVIFFAGAAIIMMSGPPEGMGAVHRGSHHRPRFDHARSRLGPRRHAGARCPAQAVPDEPPARLHRPQSDTSGAGYNLLQSMIAVGSGGFFGKGVGNASQAGAGFLPEAHTDFVFALLSEEFGFVGALVLLGLFAFLIFPPFAWRIDPTPCSCSSRALASWVCGPSSCSRRSACASVSCPSLAFRCLSSASVHRRCSCSARQSVSSSRSGEWVTSPYRPVWVVWIRPYWSERFEE